jgi:hypothetical protein
MGAPTAFCARIKSRHGDTLGDFMSSIRVWLDRRRIDVVGFDPVSMTGGILAFDMYFRSEVLSSFPAGIWETARFSKAVAERRRTDINTG